MRSLILIIIGVLIGLFGSVLWIKKDIDVGCLYLNEQFPQLMQDVSFLGRLIDKELTQDEVYKLVVKYDNGTVIQKIDNFKHYSDPKVKSAIEGNGLTFCFDEKGVLIRVDHWLNDLSPIYNKEGTIGGTIGDRPRF